MVASVAFGRVKLLARNPDGSIKVSRASRFAAAHPWVVAAASALVIFMWSRFTLGDGLRSSAVVAASLFVLQAILWFPRIGPARRFFDRLIREQAGSERDG